MFVGDNERRHGNPKGIAVETELSLQNKEVPGQPRGRQGTSEGCTTYDRRGCARQNLLSI